MIGKFWRKHAPKRFRQYLDDTESRKAVRQTQMVLAQARQLQLETEIYGQDQSPNRERNEHRG